MSDKKYLFEDFPPISAKEWKQKIQFDLKGADYQSLITHTLEGIDIKPFYHGDEFERLDFEMKRVDFRSVLLLDRIPSREETEHMLKGVDKIRIRVSGLQNIPEHIWQNERIVLETGASVLPDPVDFSHKALVTINPLTRLAAKGRWSENEESDFEKLRNWLNAGNPVAVEVDAALYQYAGANIVQQIAYALSQLQYLSERLGEEIVPYLRVKWATGYHYFFEMAKFKAFRYLFSLIRNDKEAGNKIVLYAQPSFRNKTRSDAYVNMLRTGMEVMAAVLGGVDEAGNFAYDFVYNDLNTSAERWARNQLVILKEEAVFKDLGLMTEGAYYVENIAVRLAEKALALFKQLEAGGGYLNKLKDGTVQRKIAQMAEKEQALFDEGKLVLTGTNKYPSQEERLPEVKRVLYPGQKGVKTLVRPIVPKRLSEAAERHWKKEVKQENLKG